MDPGRARCPQPGAAGTEVAQTSKSAPAEAGRVSKPADVGPLQHAEFTHVQPTWKSVPPGREQVWKPALRNLCRRLQNFAPNARIWAVRIHHAARRAGTAQPAFRSRLPRGWLVAGGTSVLLLLLWGRWFEYREIAQWKSPALTPQTPAASSSGIVVPRPLPPIRLVPTLLSAGTKRREDLPATTLTNAVRQPSDSPRTFPPEPPRRDTPIRRVPEVVKLAELNSATLRRRAVPLPEADTMSLVHVREQRFGRLQGPDGAIRLFNPEIVLVKFREAIHVAALRVEPMREREAVEVLSGRSDVEFAALDFFQQRQFAPNDAQISNQWHHAVIGSFQAWDINLGSPAIRVAIVDVPFQMDHPDLAANAVEGWDLINDRPVTATTWTNGWDAHATISAGMAAAAINNGLGVAGAGNCRILPINVGLFPAESDLANAVYWAATNHVRVVNLSWSGADSPTINAAGLYLRNQAGGLLAMAGINSTVFLNYPDQPYICAISMTDAADNQHSSHGNHIDFAAPGWAVLSTTINSGYATDSGTSFSAPLFSGVVGVLFSINPTLTPDAVVEILKNTAVDLGQPGRDQYFGWGRINFAAAAAAAAATLPRIIAAAPSAGQFILTADYQPGLNYSLWKTPQLTPPIWTLVPNVVRATNGNVITLADPSPADRNAFYRLQMTLQ